MTAQVQSDQNQKQDRAIPFFHSLRTRLGIFFLALSLLPLAATGILANLKVQSALEQQVFGQLVAIREIKAHQIEAAMKNTRAGDGALGGIRSEEMG